MATDRDVEGATDEGEAVALFDAARAGDRRALARALTLVEQGGAASRAIGARAHVAGGESGGYTIGVTGAPGAGKSTLTSALVGQVRQGGDRVAVLAIDPSSPFSGGAILGDRVRMGDHALDPGVFIRSMATRGHLGGLALAAPAAVRLLGAVGYDWVVLETVGVGQVEVDVAGEADTTLVVVNPGWGDAVQANKAGLLEIADVFVVNKADRDGAAQTRRDLEQMLDLAHESRDPGTGPLPWRPPVLDTVAVRDEGIAALWAAVGRHRDRLVATGALADRRAARAEAEFELAVAQRLLERARDVTSSASELRSEVRAGAVDPWTAADRLLGADG